MFERKAKPGRLGISSELAALILHLAKENPRRWRYFSGPGGIRTLDLFSAMDKQVGEKGKKDVYYVYFVPKSAYNLLHSLHCLLFKHICSQIVPCYASV
jgi:hypothetical protein